MPTVCMPERLAMVRVIDVQSASRYVSSEFWGSALRRCNAETTWTGRDWPAGLTIAIGFN